VTAVMNRITSIVPDAAAVGDSIANAGVLMLNGAADDNLLHRVTATGTDAPGGTGAPPSALTLEAQQTLPAQALENAANPAKSHLPTELPSPFPGRAEPHTLPAQAFDGGGRSAGDTAASTVDTAPTVTVVAEPVSNVTMVIYGGRANRRKRRSCRRMARPAPVVSMLPMLGAIRGRGGGRLSRLRLFKK
jgi:hypothetical protein